MRSRQPDTHQVMREETVPGSEVRMVAAADDVLHAVLINGWMAAQPKAFVHVAVVLAVEDDDRAEDRDVGEEPRPPQVPAARAVRHPEEGQEVVDIPHIRKITAPAGPQRE